MKKTALFLGLFLTLAFGTLMIASTACADEVKVIAVITKIDISGPDATTATVTLKANETGEMITVIVNDDLTLDKFKDHRIVEGDEIRLKYEVVDGKNISKYFRKTAGC